MAVVSGRFASMQFLDGQAILALELYERFPRWAITNGSMLSGV